MTSNAPVTRNCQQGLHLQCENDRCICDCHGAAFDFEPEPVVASDRCEGCRSSCQHGPCPVDYPVGVCVYHEPEPVVAVAPPYWCGHDAHVPGDCPWTVARQSVEQAFPTIHDVDETWRELRDLFKSYVPIGRERRRAFALLSIYRARVANHAVKAEEQAIAATAVAPMLEYAAAYNHMAVEPFEIEAVDAVQEAWERMMAAARALASPPPSSAPNIEESE